MKDYLHFGLSMPTHRTDYGSLRSREIDKIITFLQQRGLLIAECFDTHIIIVYPSLFEDIKEVLTQNGWDPLLIGATLPNLSQETDLTLAQSRTLEVCSPGPLIVLRDSTWNADVFAVTIPDSFDLRDICCIFNGTMKVFIRKNKGRLKQIEDELHNLRLEQYHIRKMGVLESPFYEEDMSKQATVVKILGPGNVKCIDEGEISLKNVIEASKSISQWEIGEWA